MSNVHERQSGSYHGQVAICSAGQTPLSRKSGRSVLSLAREAALAALDAAGMTPEELDGIIQYSVGDSVPAEAIGSAIGKTELNYVLDFAQGGQSPCYMVMHAAMAIHCGLAKSILVIRALNGRSGYRVGHEISDEGASLLRLALGYTAYPQYTAMMARRYLVETGSTSDDLAAIAIAQRQWASKNDRAILQKPLTLDDYFASPYLVEPYRFADCTSEVDGAAAVLVTSLERARDLRLPPVVVSGSAWASHGADLDMGSMLHMKDYSRNYTNQLAAKLWASAGLGPKDVDVVQLYDCFTGTFAMNLEGLGFVGRGEAGSFVRDGNTGINGSLPANTNGGLLSEGYLHGMNNVTEAVWQMQGSCGDRQVADVEVTAVCSGGMQSGSALVLTADR